MSRQPDRRTADHSRQRELLTRVVAESAVVITAAVIPGKKSPVLITADMVKAMAPGSVIVDLASERGGNCELTRTGETVKAHGVTIIDRKSTRLNSSHLGISYAVFCLKKKK